MPYCVQCGNQVRPTDLYCGGCGQRQAAAAPPPKDPAAGISPRTVSVLCYIPIVGWIAAIVVLASDRYRRDRTVRFHAFQSIYLFVGWLLVDWVVSPFFGSMVAVVPFGKFVSGVLHLAIFTAWILMLIKTSQDELFRLPVVGDLADRSVAEQM